MDILDKLDFWAKVSNGRVIRLKPNDELLERVHKAVAVRTTLNVYDMDMQHHELKLDGLPVVELQWSKK